MQYRPQTVRVDQVLIAGGPRAAFPSYLRGDPQGMVRALRRAFADRHPDGEEARRLALAFLGRQIGRSDGLSSRTALAEVAAAIEPGHRVVVIGTQSPRDLAMDDDKLGATMPSRGRDEARPQAIPAWSAQMKFEEVLRRVPAKVGAVLGFGAEQQLKQFLPPEAAATAALLFLLWSGTQANGGGFVVDTSLVAVALPFLGLAAFDAFETIGVFIWQTMSARTERELEVAVDTLAAGIVLFGVAGFKAVMRKTARKIRPSASGAASAAEENLERRYPRPASPGR